MSKASRYIKYFLNYFIILKICDVFDMGGITSGYSLRSAERCKLKTKRVISEIL